MSNKPDFHTVLNHVNSLIDTPGKLYSVESNPYLHTDHCKALLAYITLMEAKPQLKSKISTLDNVAAVKLWQTTYEPDLSYITVMFMHNIMRAVRDDYCLSNQRAFNFDIVHRKLKISADNLDLLVLRDKDGAPLTLRYAVCRNKQAKHQFFSLKDTFIDLDMAKKYPKAVFRLEAELNSRLQPSSLITYAINIRDLEFFKAIVDIFDEDHNQDYMLNTLKSLYKVYALPTIAPYVAAFNGYQPPEPATLPFLESLGTDFDGFCTHLKNLNDLNNTPHVELPTLN